MFRPWGLRVDNWAHQKASLVRRRSSRVLLLALRLHNCSIIKNSKSWRAWGSLLKWIATSQVRFLVIIEDLWLRKRILNSMLVEPTYCTLHFLPSIGKIIRKYKHLIYNSPSLINISPIGSIIPAFRRTKNIKNP